MHGDFSRLTFNPHKHYSSVRMQQGRLQIDADWNEQFDILEHRIATEITDFIGQSGTPQGAKAPGKPENGATSTGGFELRGNGQRLAIGPGRYYVDGMLLENEAEVSYTTQPDYPGVALPDQDGVYLAYLDVWKRHITALEDPSLREPALGGPDTATRLQNVWQVKLHRLGDVGQTIDSTLYRRAWQPDWEHALGSGMLRARVRTVRATLENQLYRVEMHQAGSPGTAAFKWSRDNGTVAARVAAIDGQTITVSSAGHEVQASFAANQWVEVTNAERTLKGEPGLLVELADVQDDKLMVREKGWQDVPSQDELQKLWPGDGTSVIVRRWDGVGRTPTVDSWLLLEDEVEIAFTIGNVVYKTGDYWLISARNLTGDIEWPRDASTGEPLPQLPHGIEHSYCSLALLARSNNSWRVMEDLRVLFKPLATDLVSKAGDTMLGPLTVDAALDVTGDISVGGHLKSRQDGTAVRVAGPLAIAGNVGIGTTEPSAKLEIHATTDSGGSAQLTAPETVLRLYRPGIAGQTWPNIADFSLSRYARDGTAARTRLDVGLSHGDSIDVTPVISCRSDGNVGIGTTEPGATLDVRGEIKLGPNGNWLAVAALAKLQVITGQLQPQRRTREGFNPIILVPVEPHSGFTASPLGAGSTTQISFTADALFPSPPLIMVIGADGNLIVATNRSGSGFVVPTEEGQIVFVAIGLRS